MTEKQKIVVVERKLGREGVAGQYCDGTIEIDPRQTSLERLDTLIHECLHAVFPELSEEQVTQGAATIADVLWSDRWRRIYA